MILLLCAFGAALAQDNPCVDATGTPLPGLIFVNDPSGCDKYITCIAGIPYNMTCPEGYHYFEDTTNNDQYCISVAESDCFDCPATGISYVPVPNSCSKYVLCVGGVPQPPVDCAPLVFDPAFKSCNIPGSTDCVENKCLTDPTLVMYPDPLLCDTYYVCADGQPKPVTCPAGLHFVPIPGVTPVIGTCGAPDALLCTEVSKINYHHPDPRPI